MSVPSEADLYADVTVRLDGPRPFALRCTLTAQPGEVVAVLGPNGAGKSTLLRAVAGLIPVSDGQIRLGDRVLDGPGSVWVAPDQRRVGVVFQDYRLFPTMTVRDNLAFADRARGVRRAVARSRADGWLDRFGAGHLADSRPAQLSGGQAQRIALIRALASDPVMLLLDEPLAALDATVRGSTRAELRSRTASFAGPTLIVTHDPLDALVLADRVVVIEDGQVTQDAAPEEIARRPATPYVAGLAGLNHYQGRAEGDGRIALSGGGHLVSAGPLQAGARVLVAVAPTAISLHIERPTGSSARNVWPGRIRGLQNLGQRVRVDVQGPPDALVDVTPAAVAHLRLATGDVVWLTLKATEVTAYGDPA